MVTVYHEVEKARLTAVLTYGLKIGEGGDKRNASINKTERFLNALRPEHIKNRGINRETNIYCYLAQNGKIIDITSGLPKTPAQLSKRSGQAVVQCTIEPTGCYVSNLDLFDEIMKELENGSHARARILAKTYWENMPTLNDYSGTFRRPEVIVTFSIPPSALKRVG